MGGLSDHLSQGETSGRRTASSVLRTSFALKEEQMPSLSGTWPRASLLTRLWLGRLWQQGTAEQTLHLS